MTDAQPGDEIEYTIYFMSSGTKAITDVNICDMIPANTTYVVNSMTWQLGTASENALSDTSGNDIGEYFAPGTAPTVPCPANNNRGSVVFNIAQTSSPIPTPAPPVQILPTTAAGVPSNSYGYVRFRVTVD